MTITDEQIEHVVTILKAVRDGKEIQVSRALDMWMGVNDIRSYCLSDMLHMRVKPEPRTIWVRECSYFGAEVLDFPDSKCRGPDGHKCKVTKFAEIP